MSAQFTVPVEDSPLVGAFQRMPKQQLGAVCQQYRELLLSEGQFPLIDFHIPPFVRRFVGDSIYVCTQWDPIGKTLLGKGTRNQHDIRALQSLVPALPLSKPGQFVMTTQRGALGRVFHRLGIPYRYPHLAELTLNHLSFVMEDGPKYTEVRKRYEGMTQPEMLRSFDYRELLTRGAREYLDGYLAGRPPGEQVAANLAVALGRNVVVSAMAMLLGVEMQFLDRILELSRAMDDMILIYPPHRLLKAADEAVAEAVSMLVKATRNGQMAHDRVLWHEYERLRAEGYGLEPWGYTALMLVRFSMENQIDTLNLVLSRFTAITDETEKRLLREDPKRMEGFVDQTLLEEPPVGFVVAGVGEDYSSPIPETAQRLFLPKGSFVLFCPLLLQNPVLVPRPQLVTFGYGARACPGITQGKLTDSVCAYETVTRVDIAYDGPVEWSPSAFFRRQLSAPGVLTIREVHGERLASS